jgi:hypothetical protein
LMPPPLRGRFTRTHSVSGLLEGGPKGLILARGGLALRRKCPAGTARGAVSPEGLSQSEKRMYVA